MFQDLTQISVLSLVYLKNHNILSFVLSVLIKTRFALEFGRVVRTFRLGFVVGFLDCCVSNLDFWVGDGISDGNIRLQIWL